MWVRNAWYVAGWLPEFQPGAIHARTIIDQPIALKTFGADRWRSGLFGKAELSFPDPGLKACPTNVCDR